MRGPTHHPRPSFYRRPGTLTGAAQSAAATAPAERTFPVAVVGAHGVLAVLTVVLVLLTALGSVSTDTDVGSPRLPGGVDGYS